MGSKCKIWLSWPRSRPHALGLGLVHLWPRQHPCDSIGAFAVQEAHGNRYTEQKSKSQETVDIRFDMLRCLDREQSLSPHASVNFCKKNCSVTGSACYRVVSYNADVFTKSV